MSANKKFPLDFQWPTAEPFLFCVHHLDLYPKGNSDYGPTTSLVGRDLGSDFTAKDGFRMYHGEVVPGFPVHPHRGFETITIVRKGYVDHADSLGAAGRYGQGDVQWMTAGRGVQHSEMFPLLHKDQNNTMELFQIWLNLPRKNKMAAPFFKMLWSEQIPVVNEGGAQVTLIAGQWGAVQPPAPPPDSWASAKESDVLVALLRLPKGAELNLPATNSGANRTLYFFAGDSIQLNDEQIKVKTGVHVNSAEAQTIRALSAEAEILVLQAKPIGEPVVQYGPFVMNSEAEIRQTIRDYQATQFGGWSWSRADMIHGPEIKRFARYPDGREEKPS